LQQLAAFTAVEIHDFDAVFAEPFNAAREGAAFAHYHRADTELPNEAGAVPAGREGCDHDEITVAALTAGATEGVGFGVHTGIALLDPAVMAAAEEFAGSGKQGGTDRDSAFGSAISRLFQSDVQHDLAQFFI
jgi:hypothetical protein